MLLGFLGTAVRLAWTGSEVSFSAFWDCPAEVRNGESGMGRDSLVSALFLIH